MSDKPLDLHANDLFDLLAYTTGHIQANSPAEEHDLQALQEALAPALLHESINTVKDRSFSAENSDLFFQDALTLERQARLETLANRFTQEAPSANRRVFVRDVPVRTSQISSSVPQWARGAAVDETMGPFLNKDGRQLWFDFFRITELVALYVAGQPDPAVLFNVSLIKRFIIDHLPPVTDTLTSYRLIPDSIWINSTLLASNAPAGGYTGIKIEGGEITLSAAPHVVDGKLTISAATTVTLTLDLDPSTVSDADPTSPYGIDARNLVLHLPERLTLHFSGTSGTIDAVTGNIQATAYGQSADFHGKLYTAPSFDAVINRILIPLTCSETTFTVSDCQSPFNTVSGAAAIASSAWALPTAQIDVTKPSPAAGIGGLVFQCKAGLAAQWQGLQGGEINLVSPYILCDPGRINLTDLQAGSVFCTQEYQLWKDAVNPFGSSVKIQYTASFPWIYNTLANGSESLLAQVNSNPLLDRPVTVTGQPFDIHTKGSTLFIGVNKALRLIYLYDDNILLDNAPSNPYKKPLSPVALALHNALFKVTPVNGCLLFGILAEDMIRVERGMVFLTFGMYAYVPTLPDPYAANLNVLRAQFERVSQRLSLIGTPQSIWLWLIAQTTWQPLDADNDTVDVSFHFAPLQNQFDTTSASASSGVLPQSPFVQLLGSQLPAASTENAAPSLAMMDVAQDQGLPDYQSIWDERLPFFPDDAFALLDVSSNANQMGVSFASFGQRQMAMLRTYEAVPLEAGASTYNTFPIQAQGMDVVAQGLRVRAFMPPIVSWEPVINLTDPEKSGDPPVPLNYYPDDGGPTRIANNSAQLVPIAPIPVSEFLVNQYENEPGNVTAAYFTLPFGIRSLAYLYKYGKQEQKPSIQLNRPSFANDLQGGLQFMLTAGSGFNENESNMFRGYTLQINNVLDMGGYNTGASTLGYDVSIIFNDEFFESIKPNLDEQRGVPLTRIDLSGYGASTFSNWINKTAQFAETSQARFDVLVGRTSHEVIQVKSILYPWGIHVVRTITLFRVGSDYIYRFDSGWKAESDGKFDFRFKYIDTGDGNKEKVAVPYKIHPGTIAGLFNVQNIKAANDVLPFLSSMSITGFYELDPADNKIKTYSGGASPVDVNLQPVYFDADAELESVVQGQVGGRVPSKKILGFVQLAPRGIPLTPEVFGALLDRQFGSISGPLDCIMDIGKGGQKIRVNAFDVNSSVDASGAQPVFVAAARGHVILPKDGSWSLVMHTRGTGDVTPLPDSTSVPLIRIGELVQDMTYPDDLGKAMIYSDTDLLRIANPADLLRVPVNDTINFGFLQSTNTQKILFLTPSFIKQMSDTMPGKLFSKTPPLFVDAYRLVSSKAIFPNIGDAETDFGDAIALSTGFVENALTDGGKKVLELMSISSADGIVRLKEDGYKLLKQVETFDLPSSAWYLIDEDYLKVYIEYKATTQNQDKTTTNRTGSLNYDVNSFAGAVEDRWKSLMSNLAMVVDLGSLKRLVTIKGNFNAKKGAEADYVGDSGDPDFLSPQIEFSKDLQPVIDILQILEDLQGEDYVDAVKQGLKIAMSNSANSWEYKFEASKEIPLIKFPPPLLDSPNTPLRLQASLKVGVYFNAALTTAAFGDPKQLLPTAGAYVDFYGQLSVMCVSISIATIYAVGQVNLKIAGDTKVGPSLDMQFGFGAQIVVGLPVVANVSVLYMVGVEIYADSTTLSVSAFLLFQGNADLLGGLVDVTITIEAKGTIQRTGDSTTCAAQVTFALDISIFLVIDISFSKSWEEQRQIA